MPAPHITAPLPLADAMAAGLRWLHTTAQPPRALLRHGITLATTANRTLRFCPAGIHDKSVITVDVACYDWRHDGTQLIPTEHIRPREIEQLTRLIDHLGGKVTRTWNGYPTITGTLALRHPAHPTLIAAAKRYRAGCPAHPDKGVSCSCGWYQHGTKLLIHPQIGDHPQ